MGKDLARYFPIQAPIEMQAGHAEMRALHWRDSAIEADFVIPGDRSQCLRVLFKKTDMIRVLDEMPLSTEGEGAARDEGLVPHNFAYRVEDSHFWKSQSDAFKFMNPSMEHYQFVTGSTCLDVLADTPPLMMVVPANVGPSWYAN